MTGKTIYDIVLAPYLHDARKHELGSSPLEHAESRIDEMTRTEFLYAISEALNSVLESRQAEKSS